MLYSRGDLEEFVRFVEEYDPRLERTGTAQRTVVLRTLQGDEVEVGEAMGVRVRRRTI